MKLFLRMESIDFKEKAANFEAFRADELDREEEDRENLEFYDERESYFRSETKLARQKIKRLQRRLLELKTIRDRCSRLVKTRKDCWSAEDVSFWLKTRGDTSFYHGFGYDTQLVVD